MAEETDYRMYLNERFDHLTHLVNAQFSAVNDRLDKIEAQTTKTNGRVTSLEKFKDKIDAVKEYKIDSRSRIAIIISAIIGICGIISTIIIKLL